LTESLNLATACEAAHERALTLLAVADLHVTRGELDESRRVAEDVRNICRSLGAIPTMQKADAILTRLGSEPLQPAYPAGLTAREVEVLRLVAQGLTDAEVAERLFLARRTVNTHLTSIYTKLNVNTRAAATRFAVEHGVT
jgi:DNA-binding NarL/FixJ family response regulator